MIREICIAAHDLNGGRVKEGDLIWIGPPQDGVGLKMFNDFLWIIVDDDTLPNLEDLRGDENTPIKFKYNISLDSIKADVLPTLDLAKVRDPNSHYQPFRDTDRATGLHRMSNIPTVVTPKGGRLR